MPPAGTEAALVAADGDWQQARRDVEQAAAAAGAAGSARHNDAAGDSRVSEGAGSSPFAPLRAVGSSVAAAPAAVGLVPQPQVPPFSHGNLQASAGVQQVLASGLPSFDGNIAQAAPAAAWIAAAPASSPAWPATLDPPDNSALSAATQAWLTQPATPGLLEKGTAKALATPHATQPPGAADCGYDAGFAAGMAAALAAAAGGDGIGADDAWCISARAVGQVPPPDMDRPAPPEEEVDELLGLLGLA